MQSLVDKFKTISPDTTLVCDVGNNEFWTSRAYELSGNTNRILYSKSFGALGCGIPKAIGAALNTGKPVLAIVGDQGFQINVQELQFIKQNDLPIEILVINNQTSGMIEDREKSKYGYEIHTTKESGYSALDLKKIAVAYNLNYGGVGLPLISEIEISTYFPLEPSIAKGNKMYNMKPYIDEEMISYLERL